MDEDARESAEPKRYPILLHADELQALMNSNPYASNQPSVAPDRSPMVLRLLPALMSWLIALVFLGHGLLLAGEYFANNGAPPTRIAKSILIFVITSPIAVSCLAFVTGCAWISSSQRAMRWTGLTAFVLVAYVVYFLCLLL